MTTTDAQPVVRTAALWIGFLGPAAVWMLHLAVGYAIRAADCGPGSVPPVHLISIVSLALVVFTGVRSWRLYVRLRDAPGAAARHRERFMALSGVPLAILFGAIIAAAWIGTAVTGRCLDPL